MADRVVVEMAEERPLQPVEAEIPHPLFRHKEIMAGMVGLAHLILAVEVVVALVPLELMVLVL
jgi:hypothetical protein